MSKRQKAWARTARTRLVISLGGECSDCGDTQELEFDCIQPMGERHHGRGMVERVCFYRQQSRQGNIALRCGTCNRLKADMSPLDWDVMKRTLGICKANGPSKAMDRTHLQTIIATFPTATATACDTAAQVASIVNPF